jgi:hypothetical protein
MKEKEVNKENERLIKGDQIKEDEHGNEPSDSIKGG